MWKKHYLFHNHYQEEQLHAYVLFIIVQIHISLDGSYQYHKSGKINTSFCIFYVCFIDANQYRMLGLERNKVAICPHRVQSGEKTSAVILLHNMWDVIIKFYCVYCHDICTYNKTNKTSIGEFYADSFVWFCIFSSLYKEN